MEKEVLEAYERLVSAFREGRDKFGSFADEATIVDGGRWFGSLAEYRAAWDAWKETIGHLAVPVSVETRGHEPADARRYRSARPLDREPGANRRRGGDRTRDRDDRVRSAARRSVAHRASAPLAAAGPSRRIAVPREAERLPPAADVGVAARTDGTSHPKASISCRSVPRLPETGVSSEPLVPPRYEGFIWAPIMPIARGDDFPSNECGPPLPHLLRGSHGSCDRLPRWRQWVDPRVSRRDLVGVS
jgi:hypothetical protein